jgi:hypothetical protein
MSAETTQAIEISGSRLPMNNMADYSAGSQLLAKAGFLGTKNEGEAFMVLAAIQQRGDDLVGFQQKFHLRQGRFSMTAHAILAEFIERGGKVADIVRTVDKASIKLTKGKNVYVSKLTWEEAIEEPFVYGGNEDTQLAQLDKPFEKRNLKAKYKTPRSRMQMLWARVISDGVATIDPASRLAYTPEEVDDFAPGASGPAAADVVIDPIDIESKILTPAKSKKPASKLSKGAVESHTPISASEVKAKEAATPPAASSSVSDTPPFPTEDAEDVEVITVDYTVLPIGEKAGMKWSEMPDRWLKSALESSDHRMTEQHKAEVELVIADRKDKGSK